MPEIQAPSARLIATELRPYVAQFDAAVSRRLREPQWLGQQRLAARDALVATGLPTTRDEEWRFTPVAPLTIRSFQPATRGTIGRDALQAMRMPGPVAAELVFVNGWFAPALSRLGSLPTGVTADSLAAVIARSPAVIDPELGRLARADRHAFAALNTALFDDGAVVTVGPDVAVDGVIHVLFLADAPTDAMAIHPRLLVRAGANSRLQLVESYQGAAGQVYFTNAVTELTLDAAASVDHYSVQLESRQAFHVGLTHVQCGRASRFSSHAFSLGGAWVRNEVTATMADQGAECTLNGLYLGDGHTLVDNHTTIDHAKPNCSSHEVYKGILSGPARAVFNGKIVVRPDAQKTDAKQTNKALLLSDLALINSKPQLEIFANDVKCTHGAAIGQLDEQAIFYLRARGIGERDARGMLVHAFAGEVLDGVQLEPLRQRIEHVIAMDLTAMLAGQDTV